MEQHFSAGRDPGCVGSSARHRRIALLAILGSGIGLDADRAGSQQGRMPREWLLWGPRHRRLDAPLRSPISRARARGRSCGSPCRVGDQPPFEPCFRRRDLRRHACRIRRRPHRTRANSRPRPRTPPVEEHSVLRAARCRWSRSLRFRKRCLVVPPHRRCIERLVVEGGLIDAAVEEEQRNRSRDL